MSVEYNGKYYNVEKSNDGLLALDLTKKKINNISDINGLEKLTDLESLILVNNNIGVVNGLENLKNLKILDLKKNKITEIKGLDNLKNLEVLNLRKNKITVIKGLNNLTNLKKLNLSHNYITILEGLNNLKNLEELDLYSGSLDIVELNGLGNLTKLRHLIFPNGGTLYKWLRKGNLGGIEIDGYVKNPQKLVEYCKQLDQKEKAVKREELFREISPEFRQAIKVFVSYATKDGEIYKISQVAESLTKYKEIQDVLYWQEDIHDNIIKYMNDNLGNCDVVLLFCSPNALSSVPVEKEWTAADAMGKPILPIFLEPDHIPPLLRSRLGIKFDTFDFQKNIENLYDLIVKKAKNQKK